MKKIQKGTGITLIIVCVFVLLIVGSTYLLKRPLYGNLCVNDMVIEKKSVIFYKSHIELPLLETLSELGFFIEREENDIVYISANNEIYVLNLSKKTFYALGENDFDYLQPAPGIKHYACHNVEQELYIDDNTAFIIIRTLLPDIKMDINMWKKTVYLKTD